MVVDGLNALLVKGSDTLQKTFAGDWTISFALIMPITEDGFWGYFFQKGDNWREQNPYIYKWIKGYKMAVNIATSAHSYELIVSDSLQVGVWT